MARAVLLVATCLLALAHEPLQTACGARMRPRRRTRLVLKLLDFSVCPPDRKHYLAVDNVSIILDKDGGEHLDWYWTTRHRLNSMHQFLVVIHRCGKSGGGCEYFTTWDWTTALCSFMLARDALWSPIVESTTPTVRCPMEAGRYHTTNGTLNLEMVDSMGKASGLENYVWKTETQLWDDAKHMILCNMVAFELRRFAVRPARPPEPSA